MIALESALARIVATSSGSLHGARKESAARAGVDGRPRRLDLARREARAVARSHDPRTDPFAALWPGGLRGCARLSDPNWNRDFPAAGAHRSAVRLGAYLHDEDSVHARAPDGGTGRGGARESSRGVLHSAGCGLPLREDGRLP